MFNYFLNIFFYFVSQNKKKCFNSNQTYLLRSLFLDKNLSYSVNFVKKEYYLQNKSKSKCKCIFLCATLIIITQFAI